MNGRKLSVGAVGEEVRSLQERLRRQGHELPESELSRAFFGPGTREAVRQVQLQHGLQAHGVVDADCRVHGVDNVFVAGASAFPTAGFVNPVLTIVALAERLADHLSVV